MLPHGHCPCKSVEANKLTAVESKPVNFPGSRTLARVYTADSAVQTALVIVLLAAATAIRLIHLNAVGYNSDEAVYAGQAAAIARVPVLAEIFPIFRAHPLLFQFTLALFFRWGANDLVGRLISVAVGVATVFLVYRIGRRLYGPSAGAIAALFMALMPYHVIVSRQVLLDGPMVFCSTLTLYLLVRFAQSGRAHWLYTVGAGMGLTFLAKETGILMIGAIYAFLALTPRLRLRLRDLFISMLTMLAVMSPFPLSIALAGGSSSRSGQNYLVWQLFRRPNHTWDFYPTVVPPAIGLLVILAALAGLWLLRRENDWREKLLVLWIVVPAIFFQLWPTKGFQYLLPLAPSFALLAGRTLTRWPQHPFRLAQTSLKPTMVQGMAIFGIAISLVVPTWNRIVPSQSDTFLAGSGGVPGGREMGAWISANVPEDATFLAIGPSMANIIKFYGHQQAYGLSVSPNPLHRNPSYEPVHNPDFQIRTGAIQYLVWDSFSAERTSFFSEKLLLYVQKYHGRAVHTETVTITGPEGAPMVKPVIIVYEVRP